VRSHIVAARYGRATSGGKQAAAGAKRVAAGGKRAARGGEQVAKLPRKLGGDLARDALAQLVLQATKAIRVGRQQATDTGGGSVRRRAAAVGDKLL